MLFSRLSPLCRHVTAALLAIIAASLITACAGPRWSEMEPQEEAEVLAVVKELQKERGECPDSLDADVSIYWKTPLSSSAVNGYLQLRSPSHVKLIVNSPLGMVLYAFASDGSNFEILNIAQRRHIRGNLRTLAIRKELPVVLAQDDWFATLSGSLPETPLTINTIKRDSGDRTVWLEIDKGEDNRTADRKWIHLDINQKKLLGYLFLDSDGAVLADISYEEKSDTQKRRKSCLASNRTILITGLPWGTEIRIELQDIRTDTPLEEDDFSLPVPENYFRQLMP